MSINSEVQMDVGLAGAENDKAEAPAVPSPIPSHIPPSLLSPLRSTTQQNESAKSVENGECGESLVANHGESVFVATGEQSADDIKKLDQADGRRTLEVQAEESIAIRHNVHQVPPSPHSGSPISPALIALPESPSTSSHNEQSAKTSLRVQNIDSTDPVLLSNRFLGVPDAHVQNAENPNFAPFIEFGEAEQRTVVSRGEEAIESESEKEQANTTADDSLAPDPGTESEFEVKDNPFAFSPGQLQKLFNPKNVAALHALGGLYGLEKGLRTNIRTGLDAEEDVQGSRVTFEEATEVLRRITSARPSAKSSVIEQTFSRMPTTFTSGEQPDSFLDRKRVFGDGLVPPRKAKSLLYYLRKESLDAVLIVLAIASLVTIGLGLYQALRQEHLDEGFSWPEGVAIFVAVLIVMSLGAINDWRKEHHFTKLNQMNRHGDRPAKVIRSGKVRMIPIPNVLVGDVVLFDPGDTIFADGVLIRGQGVKCDESQITGESDLLKKSAARYLPKDRRSWAKFDPFIISGSVIESGRGSFLVTAVGRRSSDGKTLMYLWWDSDIERTHLQKKLDTLANWIAKVGITISVLLFLVLLIRFLVQLKHSSDNGVSKGLDFLSLFIISLTLIDVAVPSGLPLALTIAMAFATRQLLKKNILVRNISACETLEFTTTICTEKTGLLTDNAMSIVAGTIAGDHHFEDVTLMESPEDASSNAKNREGNMDKDKEANLNSLQYIERIHPEVKELLRLSIVTTLTAFEGEYQGKKHSILHETADIELQLIVLSDAGGTKFFGPQLESALFDFTKRHLITRKIQPPPPLSRQASNRTDNTVAEITSRVIGGIRTETALSWSHAPQTCYITSESCKFTVCITDSPNGKHRMFVTGLAGPLLARCTSTLADRKLQAGFKTIDADTRGTIEILITKFASTALRVIGFGFKDFDKLPPHQSDENGVIRLDEDVRLDNESLFKNMTFLCALGIKDPIRDDALEAVQLCQNAGIYVRLVTADDVLTAKAVGRDTGILVPGGLVMEGSTFRLLSKRDLDTAIPRLCVLARASPDDKRRLVKRLRELGETVAVTAHGHTIHDVPALKTADVSFSLGSTSTDHAKTASSIVLLQDGFRGIIDAVFWGRAVGNGVRKFLQFQLTIGLTAVILTFVSSAFSRTRQSVLNGVQLLWVNLIM
ncbi:plasma membrane calcium [Kalmusia sp. IMI 367209]|nr:plasma membrane calcium [Kalmusia sp. IMI 367209]